MNFPKKRLSLRPVRSMTLPPHALKQVSNKCPLWRGAAVVLGKGKRIGSFSLETPLEAAADPSLFCAAGGRIVRQQPRPQCLLHGVMSQVSTVGININRRAASCSASLRDHTHFLYLSAPSRPPRHHPTAGRISIPPGGFIYAHPSSLGSPSYVSTPHLFHHNHSSAMDQLVGVGGHYHYGGPPGSRHQPAVSGALVPPSSSPGLPTGNVVRGPHCQGGGGWRSGYV